MYPKLSDLINDLLGTSINLPIQSYGFFLAMAFFVSSFLLHAELKRKEKEGLIKPSTRVVWKGKPMSISDLIVSFLLSFIIGFKFFAIFANYDYFANNPQDFIASFDGSWLGGFLSAVAYTLYMYNSKNKAKLTPPIKEKVLVHAQDQTWPIVFVAIVFGIIGAKVFHWFENWDEFMADPLGSLVSFSGLTFYGGLIVAAFAVGYYGEKNDIRWRHIADAIAPTLIIAYGIGRIGCHIAGDGDWGIVNTAIKPDMLSFLPDWLWAYNYPNNIINEGIKIPGCIGEHCYQLAYPVYPTAIYETLMCVVIFAILWSIRKKVNIAGQLTGIYLMLNGMERFLIEKIRVNNVFNLFGLNVTQAEVISTFLFISGVIMFFYFKKYKSVKP